MGTTTEPNWLGLMKRETYCGFPVGPTPVWTKIDVWSLGPCPAAICHVTERGV
ncbi:MAG: hypothetical protein JNM80_12375 [Phycisphaerae bacterium]|nr:hypothetical protein [Phycisphaerae bacterium]